MSANPFLPATPIPANGQRVEFSVSDPVNNPTDPNDPLHNRYLWPPSIHCDDVETIYASVDVPKVNGHNATSVTLRVYGNYLMDVGVENQNTTWGGMYLVSWSQIQFDIWVGTAPTALTIDTPDLSMTQSPWMAGFYLNPFDGFVDFAGASGIWWPNGTGNPNHLPIGTTTGTGYPPYAEVTTTDAGLLALFNGASGNVTIYMKPRIKSVLASYNGGSTWGPLGTSGFIGFSKERFLGTGYVQVERA